MALTLQQIAKTKKRKTQLKGIESPKSVELFYYKELRKLVKELESDVRNIVLPTIKDNAITTDSTASNILLALSTLQNKYANIIAFSSRVANEVVERIDRLNGDKFYRNIQQSLGVDISTMINQNKLNEIVQLQKAKNVSLIKSIPEQFINAIEIIVQNGISQGLRYEEIAKQIKGVKGIHSTFGKLENRVKLIARNEVSTINANLTKARFEEAGITKSRWETAADDRVRPCHADRDGKVYDLKKGCYSSCDNKYLQVGEEINCRCTMTPIIDED